MLYNFLFTTASFVGFSFFMLVSGGKGSESPCKALRISNHERPNVRVLVFFLYSQARAFLIS